MVGTRRALTSERLRAINVAARKACFQPGERRTERLRAKRVGPPECTGPGGNFSGFPPLTFREKDPELVILSRPIRFARAAHDAYDSRIYAIPGFMQFPDLTVDP